MAGEPVIWFANQTSEQPVPVRWLQSGTGPGFWSTCAGRSVDTLGTWRQTPEAHALTFYPGGASPDALHHKVRLRLGISEVSMDLMGMTRWSHTFIAGWQQASLLHNGGRVIPVVVHNTLQNVHVTSDGGHVQLVFTLADADDISSISLDVSFGRMGRLVTNTRPNTEILGGKQTWT